MIYLIRLGLIILLPFMWLPVLVDILIGDAVIGVKTPIKQKIKDHKDQFIELWNTNYGQ